MAVTIGVGLDQDDLAGFVVVDVDGVAGVVGGVYHLAGRAVGGFRGGGGRIGGGGVGVVGLVGADDGGVASGGTGHGASSFELGL
ncbi:hypothetical protein BJF87_12675 [Gordonia sp. CNJ-863]|uniref:hypothetical protein n=1 Tax=Gordonia sp. CNJ-863 TaxID=1904963 RepID=UPI000959C713|nr:hypothetical protein [Gordonia sp. CNJ-863]OLT52925.1 hypothetical protein BJF87_12675 [Gordonia sp. CNJ-863]